MEFNSSNGISFKLKIEGYQYPELLTEYWDSNWLYINIVINHPKGNSTATDPSLTTFEIKQLSNWLEAVYHRTNKMSSCGFTEPYIEFEIIKNKRNQETLRIYLERKYLPTWGSSKGIGSKSFWIEFPTNEINLLVASKELQLQLENFPQRVFRK
jgi:hypothetical protein